MKEKLLKILLSSFFIFILSFPVRAQYYRVYGWETPKRGWMELTLWNKGIVNSDLTFEREGQEFSREGLFLHSAEVEYGVTDKFAVGVYGDFRNSGDTDLQFYRFRAVARYSLFSKFERFFNTALYLEYYLPSSNVPDPAEVEMRLILQKDIGDFRLKLNPAVSMDTSGEEVKEGINGNFFSGIYWRRYYPVQLGVEYYGRYGQIRHLPPASEQEQVLFGVVDLRFFRGFKWQLGAGTGLTQGSDDFLVKSILTYEFGTIRPSRQRR
ncbi:MAG: hypothetical protein WBV11_09815 [Salegentibacter sp.]